MLPDFQLETYFSKWEFNARYHLTASDAQSITLSELLSMASEEDRTAFYDLSLGYTQTYGAPDLRTTIAGLYQHNKADNILCFAGASEAIYAANAVLLNRDSHAVVITPNYQSHETLPLSWCSATAVPLDENDAWSLDIDRVAAAIKPNTTLLTINFPHNPTGAILPLDRYNALIALCRQHGIYILHDEIFRGLGRSGVRHLPFIADEYERGLSINVMSKSYGLPGLRIGWIACQDKKLLVKMERLKHYLSICNSAPSERLANIALKAGDKLLARTCAIVDKNLLLLDNFFSRHADKFAWAMPDGSCTAFPQYLGDDGVENFCENLIEKSGVLLLPGSKYASQLTPIPPNRFRIGYGREGMAAGLAAMEEHFNRYY